MSIIMLACLMRLGLFAFPVGIPICGIIGLVYGIRNKNKPFIKWCSLALIIGVTLVIYTLILIKAM